MTAEVCIMSRAGIAIAADSTVTLSSSRGEKTYPSAEKMFNLSHDAPVGIMVYGNASFLGLMWETIVKEYRRRLASTRFDYLQQYVDDFLAFLVDKDIFTDEAQDECASRLVGEFFELLWKDTINRLNYETSSQNELNEEDIPSILTDEIKSALGELKTVRERVEEFDKNFVSRIGRKYKEIITGARKTVFKNFPLEQAAVRLLNRIGVELLSRKPVGLLETGVVFSGFGEKEFYPRLYSIRIEGSVLRKLRLVREDSVELSDEFAAAVRPFAQQEMVHAFLDGIHPEINQFIRATTEELLEKIIAVIGEEIGKIYPDYDTETASLLNNSGNQLVKSIFDSWDQKIAKHWKPVMEIVESLEKDELASMAESLVNLTKFRRRVTPEQETVGGPIDVAVITKGDGFIWVKRKHYYSTELNPRVMARYLRGDL